MHCNSVVQMQIKITILGFEEPIRNDSAEKEDLQGQITKGVASYVSSR